jgi:hypothetical protein
VAIRFRRELGLVVAWLVFPLVPVILEDLYYQVCNSAIFQPSRFGPDPRDWDWNMWVIMLGPLVGYGFLVGATPEAPDDLGPPRRPLRRLLARRAVWVAIGPWCGFLFWAAMFLGLMSLNKLFPGSPSPPQAGNVEEPESWMTRWAAVVLSWVVFLGFGGTLCFGWLWPAWAALRRAARIGRLSRALYRGLAIAIAFVGSLFGSFWAATSLLRSYFFDPRAVPLIVAVVGLATLSGCSGTITYGELRRRELFHAMLVAWVLGLAFLWRWWSRPRPGPPQNGTMAGPQSPS